MAATRFMRELEVRAFGRPRTPLRSIFFPFATLRRYWQLSVERSGLFPNGSTKPQKIKRTSLHNRSLVLAEEGKVICVRLALFAEMMKGKVWTPATLKEVGGTKGVGVTFLEETFSAATCTSRTPLPPESSPRSPQGTSTRFRYGHQRDMRSHAELLEASGYGSRHKDFDDLVRILDSEIRLITPTDPEGKYANEDSVTQAQTGEKYFQLTHDYLVHSLRDWLTRKQKETRKGRAELALFDTGATWNSKPENRFLPSMAEWFNIRTLTNKKSWTQPQRVMMRRADRFHLSRMATVASLLSLISLAGLWTWHRLDQNRLALLAQKVIEQEATRIEGLVGRLKSAEPAQVPEIVKELDGNQEVATIFLSPLLNGDAQTRNEKRSQLHARLATVSRDKSLVAPLLEEMLTNKEAYIYPIRQQLRTYSGEITEKLWAILRNEMIESNRRFRAAIALADYVNASDTIAWTKQDIQFVAGQLVVANPEFQPLLRENLRPISQLLLPDLERIFGDSKSTIAQRLSAANAFADFAASDIPKLSHLLTVATPEQHAVLYPLVAATSAPSTIEYLSKIAATLPATELGSGERVVYGQHRANSALTLLRLGERERVLPVFAMTDDSEALTQFIFRCRERGVRVNEVLDLLQLVTQRVSEGARESARAHYALLLTLGEYTLSEIPESRREGLLTQLAYTYRNNPSSGVHGAAGWLLRQWGQADVVREVDQTERPYSTDCEWFTLAITVTPTPRPISEEKPGNEKEDEETTDNHSPQSDETKKVDVEDSQPEPLTQKTFYYTFVVFPTGESNIGSVSDEADRKKDEVLHSVRLTRPFALLDRELTMEELIAYDPNYARYMPEFDAKPTDAGFAVHWYDSVAFCRWLGTQSGILEGDQSYASPESLSKEEFPREPSAAADWAPRHWPTHLVKPGFRLPTEAEWEVGCSATARTAFGFGSEASLLNRFGWFQENSGMRVHRPRELRPSVRGLFDMHGNVYEWTHDWFANYEATEVVDPVVSDRGTARVNRGGSWLFAAAYSRKAYRNTRAPTDRAGNIGFRIAMSLFIK